MEINRNSYTVLKYISKRSGAVPYQKVFTKFSKLVNPSIDATVNWLLCQKLIQIGYSDTNELGDSINPDTIFSTIEGENVVEDRSSRNTSDVFARTTAILAILLSVVSIVISVILSK